MYMVLPMTFARLPQGSTALQFYVAHDGCKICITVFGVNYHMVGISATRGITFVLYPCETLGLRLFDFVPSW